MIPKTVKRFKLAALPGPSPFRLAGRRCGALEVSDRLAAARSLQREPGALKVYAEDGPAAARYIDRPGENLSTRGLHALRRRIDIDDVEIIQPEGNRYR